MNTGSGSPRRKYTTPTSGPNRQSGGEYLSVAVEAAAAGSSARSNRSVLMRTKFGRLGLPVISINGEELGDPDRERLCDGNGFHGDDHETGGGSDSEDDTDLLTTLSKVVTTRSLRLQRVTRLIEASQSFASAKIKKRAKVGKGGGAPNEMTSVTYKEM